jgi:hypothetical protein
MSVGSSTHYIDRLPNVLIPPIIAYIGPVDYRRLKTTCSRFSVHGSQNGISRISFSLLTKMLEYLDQPKEDTCFRMTCVRFRNYYPRSGYLNFDSALSYCKTLHCYVGKHVFKHCLAVNRILPKYRYFGCKIREIVAINHGIRDGDLAQLQGHPLEVLKITGDNITEVGMKILAGLPIKELHFYGLQHPDNTLEYLKGMQLRILCLSASDITDGGLKHLENVPLEKLKISCYYWGALITGYGLKYLWKMPLKDLEIQESWLHSRNLHLLKRLPLERLSLGTSLPTLAFANLSTFKQDMPTLKILELNGLSI